MLSKKEIIELLKKTILNLSKANSRDDVFGYDRELSAYLKVLNDDELYSFIEDNAIKGLLEYIDKNRRNNSWQKI